MNVKLRLWRAYRHGYYAVLTGTFMVVIYGSSLLEISATSINYIDDKQGWPFEKVTFNHPIQSPVDIITSKAVTRDLPTLDFVEPSDQVMTVFYNSGSTAYVLYPDVECRPYLVGGPLREKFLFEQLHFHWGTEDSWGSEHFVDGESYAIEIHMVYFNSLYDSYVTAKCEEDGLAVLTMFAEATNYSNPLIEPLHKCLANVTLAQTWVLLDSAEALQWPASALSLNSEYYTYPGSLTTKPFTENVVFIILPKPITLSSFQLQAFRNIQDDNQTCIGYNIRNLQPLHSRPIVRGIKLH